MSTICSHIAKQIWSFVFVFLAQNWGWWGSISGFLAVFYLWKIFLLQIGSHVFKSVPKQYPNAHMYIKGVTGCYFCLLSILALKKMMGDEIHKTHSVQTWFFLKSSWTWKRNSDCWTLISAPAEIVYLHRMRTVDFISHHFHSQHEEEGHRKQPQPVFFLHMSKLVLFKPKTARLSVSLAIVISYFLS